MISSYLTTAFRNVWKHKVFSLINILGLAIGFGCTMLIYLWVQDELSYDRFHQQGNNLYKVNVELHHSSGSNSVWEATPGPLAPTLIAEFPEIKQAIRMSYSPSVLLTCNNKTFPENGYFVDSVFFQVFTFPLL